MARPKFRASTLRAIDDILEAYHICEGGDFMKALALCTGIRSSGIGQIVEDSPHPRLDDAWYRIAGRPLGLVGHTKNQDRDLVIAVADELESIAVVEGGPVRIWLTMQYAGPETADPRVMELLSCLRDGDLARAAGPIAGRPPVEALEAAWEHDLEEMGLARGAAPRP